MGDTLQTDTPLANECRSKYPVVVMIGWLMAQTDIGKCWLKEIWILQTDSPLDDGA